MENEIKKIISESICDFHLPSYTIIPDVGLYLEQVTKYISDYLTPLGNVSITGSMISNYVKKDLIDNPVRKQYSRDQIAYLMFIVLAKSVLSLEDIQLLFQLQKQTYEAQRAYDYFCKEFENILYYVFGLKDTLDEVGSDHTETKTLLRTSIIAIAHKIYLDKCFSLLSEKL